MKSMIATLTAATLLSLPALASPMKTMEAGDEHGMEADEHAIKSSIGQPWSSAPDRQIDVILTESDQGMIFKPGQVDVEAGEAIRFVLRNEGVLDHEFVIGTAESNTAHAMEMMDDPDMVHESANAKRVPTGASASLQWQFTEAGTYEYSCSIPGHREAGMVGTILVK
ncbi:cupredoxin domain-containing protein [Afifella pfennigii]|uniref:cupredoxin domain-containing protein n=1 Tax=Afifella pfennigii TaxID=209897 RepID=UPI00047DE785|nr:plastocyanin/azurin family copper-binding protein [Afifella pfennigii]